MSCYFLGGLVVDMIGVVSSSQQRSMYTPTRVKGSEIAMRSSASIVSSGCVYIILFFYAGCTSSLLLNLYSIKLAIDILLRSV